MRLAVPVAMSLAIAGPAAANNCVPARMMLVLDRSTSMQDVVSMGGPSKWQAAQTAVNAIATGYERKIDLGLMIFPGTQQCSPGRVLLEPLPVQAGRIMTEVAKPPLPDSWTPMAASIDVAAADPMLHDLKRANSLLLVTDGEQWCSPYDPATRFTPVDAVKRARAKGLKVYVVGFGGGVDVLSLNRMADSGGTGLAGCDPTGADLASPKKCYYQADNLQQLQQALDSIAVKVAAEVCDGLDNDCNGLVDEALVRSCNTACGGGFEQCHQGAWIGCDAPRPNPELCDSKDNNCNGTVDEGCGCVPGSTRPCGERRGSCRMGIQGCDANGQWRPDCRGAVGPVVEICNGVDDDCNGTVDDPSPSMCPLGAFCSAGQCLEELNRKPGTVLGELPPDSPQWPNPNGLPGAGDDYPTDPNDGHGNAAPANGCGCRLGAPSSAVDNLALLFVGLAAALLLVRRR